MALKIVTADERLAEANNKTTLAIFGPSGVGKTSLLKTLPARETLCIDLEAGMKSVQDWPGDSIPVRTFADAIDIGCLVGGVLKHLQHAQAKTVIFVGILEKVTDEFSRAAWQPQMEGGKAGRELPGIVDQVISMSFFSADGEGWRHEPERGETRRLVCRAGNPFGLPAKDRSGRLDVTEPPDLGALLSKINATTKG